MTQKDVSLGPIGQIMVPVKDVARATVFYRDVLGMKFLFDFPPRMAFFDAGGVRLFLDRPETKEFDHSSVIYYRVPSVPDAYEVLKGRGAQFEDKPHIVHQDARHELWMAFMQDSEGNHVAIMEERPKKV